MQTSTHQTLQYRDLSLQLDVALDSTHCRVRRRGTGSHGDPSAPEHEIAARSESAIVNANVLGRIAAISFAHTRARDQPI
jgi:hypothetical protein